MKPANLFPLVTGRKEFGFPAEINQVRVLHHIPIGLKDTRILAGFPIERPCDGRRDSSIPMTSFASFSLLTAKSNKCWLVLPEGGELKTPLKPAEEEVNSKVVEKAEEAIAYGRPLKKIFLSMPTCSWL